MKRIEAANVILGEAGPSATFILRWMGLGLRLKIRPLTVRGIIQISKEMAQMTEIGTEAVFRNQLESAGSLTHICRAIAIATRTPFIGLVADIISDLPIENVKRLWAAVIAQSDPESFFFIMVSAKGMDKLKARQKAASQSSAGSQ